MRIGLLTAELNATNGWATYSLNLARQLRARGLDITIVCAHNSPQIEFETHPLLPTVAPLENRIFAKSLRHWNRARHLLRDCDIIHSTVEPYALLGHALAGARPHFVTAHGSYVNLPRMHGFPAGPLYRRAFERARLICVSHYTAQVAQQLLPAARVHVVSNGVDAGRFLDPPPLTVEKHHPTVVTAGGVKPRKGTRQLVEAIAIVREQLPAVQCLILGSADPRSRYTQAVQRRIAELQLEDSVQFLGFVDDDLMRAWLAAADVFALPSVNDGLWFEGFGLVLLEAGAAGTAVVGTDGCGVADAIEDGVTGLVVSQARVAEELPRALLRLLADPALAARMGAAGRQRALAQTWSHVADQVVALYQGALA